MSTFEYLTHKPIDIPAILASVSSPETGGIVSFMGIVRNNHKGRIVHHLEYEAYELMANRKIKEIILQAKQQWGLNFAMCIHRLGRLYISECAVVVITCSAHRSQAYDANRYIIDRVKLDVPIWKNEYFSDGSSEWGKN
jgi:molybdopterin synthase catalytic subunit